MAELLAANQITIAKVLDGAKGDPGDKGDKGDKGEMSAEQLTQLNQASEDAANAQTDINTLSDKTRSGHIETLSGSGFVQSTKTEDGGTTEVVVYGKSVQDGTPTPEAPVEIQSVENPKVTACGKNLLKHNTTGQTKAGITYTVNKDGSVTLNGTSTALTFFNLNYIAGERLPRGSYIVSGGNEKARLQILINDAVVANDLGNGATFAVGDNATTTWLRIVIYANQTFENETIYPMIRSANVEDSGYEPYNGNTATLSGIVLMSIPDGTRDKLFKDTDGLWKVDRKCGVVDLGSLDWELDGAAYTFGMQAWLPDKDNFGAIINGYTFVNRSTDTTNINKIYKTIRYTEGYGAIYIKDTSYTDATTFKSAMSGVMAVYELATPTYEILPDSIQSELNALTTYNPITNVIASDGVMPDIDVSFWTRDYRAKSMAENAQTGVDSLNDTVFGVRTFEYILDGVTIPAHKREDGTYYYILNDEEVTVAEANLVHDSDGNLVSYQDGGIYESLDNMSGNIEAIGTKVNSFDARETAIYNAIQDNSLIARKNARVEGNSLIITNDTATEDIASLLNYLQLNADSIVIYGNGKDIVTIAKTADDSGYMKMNGTSLLQAQESRLSTIRLRSADGTGNLAFVAGSDGHVSLREVLD